MCMYERHIHVEEKAFLDNKKFGETIYVQNREKTKFIIGISKYKLLPIRLPILQII